MGGFTVMDTPGHSPGHISFWRDSDRTLVCGDIFFGLDPLTGRPGLHEPPRPFTYNVDLNRESARRVARLQPALVLFGHGPPLRDTERLVRFAQALPG